MIYVGLLVLVFVWGGFVYFVTKAIRSETEKNKNI